MGVIWHNILEITVLLFAMRTQYIAPLQGFAITTHPLIFDVVHISFIGQQYKIMLRKRSIIGSVNDMLKNVAQLVHTRHRSVHNFLMNMLAAMGAYCFFSTKPAVNFDYEVPMSDGQLVLWQ